MPISSYDTAGSFLLLGCTNGSIYYIGKFVIIISFMCGAVVFEQVHR